MHQYYWRSICCLATTNGGNFSLNCIFSSFLNHFQFIFWWGKKLKAIFIMRSFLSTSYICVLAENSCVKSSPVCPSSFIEKPLRLTYFLVWLPGSKIFLTSQIWWQMKIKKDQFLISAAVVLLQKLPLWWWKKNNKRVQGSRHVLQSHRLVSMFAWIPQL